MKVALVFPPQGHFTQPYLSLPSLSAYLRERGIEVAQIDANMEAYEHFLSRDRLTRSFERVNAMTKLKALDAKPSLNYSEREDYQLLSEIALTGIDVVQSIDEAKSVLRDPEQFYDYERYMWAGRTIEQGLRLFSAEYSPTKLTAHGFVMRHRVECSEQVIAALSDEDENPYLEYFRDFTLPRLQAEDPDLIGLSVTFPSQAIPALTLARLIKEWKPGIHITMGGGLLAYVGEKLSRRPEVWDLIDSMVLLEGEGPLHGLCEHVQGRRELASIPNLLYRGSEGDPAKTTEVEPLDIKDLPTPDFDGLPLDKYLSPELVLPLAATRGCYWGKCVFCTLYTVIGPGYRGRTIEQTVEDMGKLQAKYGANAFYLAIEDLPPNMAKQFPRAILDAGLDVKWWCDARLEHDVFDQEVCDMLAQSGCKRIAFGYESSSTRVLDKMCKGIDPEASLDLIRRVRKAGISVSLYCMVGFPTETREEARQTLQTILDNKDLVQEVSVRVFYLDETSEVYKRREEFDIVEVYPDEEADLQVYYDFKTSSGMSRKEARESYLEFTRALRSNFPVFENTNILYHELKGHYFLYLAHHGSFEAMHAEVLSGREEPLIPARPKRRRNLHELALRYDRSEIDDDITGVFSSALRPRYQTDLIDDTDRAMLDARHPRLEPRSTRLLHHPPTGQVVCLSSAAARILEQCDGVRSTADILAGIPDEHHEAARACLGGLAREGLLEGDPDPVPAS